MKIVIDADLRPQLGSMATATLALIRSLVQMEGPETYTIIIRHPELLLWLLPLLEGHHSKIVLRNKTMSPADYKGADVVHFPSQFNCRVKKIPTLYTVHDSPWKRFPKDFHPEDVKLRDSILNRGVGCARSLVTMSEWNRKFIEEKYSTGWKKSRDWNVIRWPPPTALFSFLFLEPFDFLKTFAQEHPFILYPAATWPQKNHLALFEALRILRDNHGLRINLVCPGFRTVHALKLEERLDELKLAGQVHFFDVLPQPAMRALYQLCRFVVLPSKWEAGGVALIEAMNDGAAVLCSDLPALREYGGDISAEYVLGSESFVFPNMLAQGILQLWTDSTFLKNLQREGRFHVARIPDWTATAIQYRDIYRKLAG